MKETKAPSVVKSTLSSNKSDSLVIDFESLLVPVSILLAGLMVSLSIIFTFRGANLTTVGSKTNTNTDTTADGGTDSGKVDANTNDGTIAEVSVDDDPYQGDKNKAKVAIIEFSDYECPFCKRHFQEVYPQLYEKYIKTGQAIYVYRDLPLSFHEPAASLDAMAAQCVFAQGGNEAYFKFHDSIFNTTQSNGSNMTETILINLAKKQSGVNVSKFTTCLQGKTYKEEITKDSSDAAKIGISGTPGFVIGKLESDGKTIKNATFLGGAYPFENFQTTIDSYLK